MEQQNNFVTPKYMLLAAKLFDQIGETGKYDEATYQEFLATEAESDPEKFNSTKDVINKMVNDKEMNGVAMKSWKELNLETEQQNKSYMYKRYEENAPQETKDTIDAFILYLKTVGSTKEEHSDMRQDLYNKLESLPDGQREEKWARGMKKYLDDTTAEEIINGYDEE